MTSCTACWGNSFSASGSSTCTCNSGFYPSGSTCPPCWANSNSVAGAPSCTCNDGYYPNNGACDLCPAGSECASNSIKACKTGHISPSGASACTACAAGTYRASVSECLTCAAGKYSGSAAVGCTACAAGKSSAVVGAGGEYECNRCDAGSYAPIAGATACTPCSPGTASSTSGLSTACGACESGRTFAASAGLTACTPCSVRSCALRFGPSQCIPTADSVCEACKTIVRCTYITVGQCVRPDASPACVCDPGYEMASGVCQLCALGKFKGQADYSVCTPWTTTVCPEQGTYLVQGSPYNNSACLACPELPTNAVRFAGECSWGCEAGFDDNQFI